MQKFRKKPVEIEAIRFEDSVECLQALSEAGFGPVHVDYDDPANPVLAIETLEGVMTARLGDYIIKGVKGEFYPCKPDIFQETYEPSAPLEIDVDEAKARLAGLVLGGLLGQWNAEKHGPLAQSIPLNFNLGSGIGHSSMQSLARNDCADS